MGFESRDLECKCKPLDHLVIFGVSFHVVLEYQSLEV